MEIDYSKHLLALFLEVWLYKDMNKNVVLIVVVILVIAAVGGGAVFMMRKNKIQNTAAMPTPSVMTTQESPMISPAATDAGSMQTDANNTVKFTVEGSNFKFAPSALKVKKGDSVEITFKNVGGTHNLVIDEFKVATNKIGDGEEETVSFVADKTGTFDYYCSVGNHRAMGMQGVLTVE